MKAEKVVFPSILGAHEGKILKWHVKEGDYVKTGQSVADIETSVATVEYESYQEGYLLYRGVMEGESIKVGYVLCIVGDQGADIDAILKEAAQEYLEDPDKFKSGQNPYQGETRSVAENEVTLKLPKWLARLFK